jgi:hypothetical protein
MVLLRLSAGSGRPLGPIPSSEEETEDVVVEFSAEAGFLEKFFGARFLSLAPFAFE